MAVAFAGVWHAANAIAMFHRAAAGQENVLLLAILAQAAKIALAILPAPLLDQAAIWSGITRWYAAPLYLVIPLVVWWTNAYSAWVGVGLAAAAGLCLYAQRFADATGMLRSLRAEAAVPLRFFRAFSIPLLAVPAAGLGAGPGSAWVVLASLAPPVCFTYFVYRYNFLGLLISRRILFALKMGSVV